MPPKDQKDPNLILGSGRYIAMQKAPYMSALLLSLAIREAPGLGTVGTTRGLIMGADFDVIRHWTVDQMATVFLHECMHVQLKFWARLGARDPALFNQAQDIAMNQMLTQMGMQFPTYPGPHLTPELYGFPAGLTTEAYYDLLVQRQAENGSADGDGNGKGSPKRGVCSGGCGGVAGNPSEGEPGDEDEASRSDIEQRRILRTVAEAIKDHAARRDGAGSIPGELLRWAEETCAPPKIKWQDKLAVATRFAVNYRPGAHEHYYGKLSRRQAGIGYGSGVPILPAFRQPCPRVDIVADTSGSMGAEELGKVLRESRGILTATGADVRFSACDAAVNSFAPVRSAKDILRLLKGGGGTVFQPAFDALAKARPQAEVAVVITDGGWFDKPVIPESIKTIIVLVGAHRVVPQFTGKAEVIEVDD